MKVELSYSSRWKGQNPAKILEIETLDDLLGIMRKEKQDLVLSFPIWKLDLEKGVDLLVEVYDDYRE